MIIIQDSNRFKKGNKSSGEKEVKEEKRSTPVKKPSRQNPSTKPEDYSANSIKEEVINLVNKGLQSFR